MMKWSMSESFPGAARVGPAPSESNSAAPAKAAPPWKNRRRGISIMGLVPPGMPLSRLALFRFFIPLRWLCAVARQPVQQPLEDIGGGGAVDDLGTALARDIGLD